MTTKMDTADGQTFEKGNSPVESAMFNAAISIRNTPEAPVDEQELEESRKEIREGMNQFIPPELSKLREEHRIKQEQTDREEVVKVSAEKQHQDLENIDPDSIDLNPDAVRKMLLGQDEELPVREEAPALPFWHEDEDFKSLSTTLTKYGVTAEKLNEVIKKVADKTVVDNSKLVDGVRNELTESKKKVEYLEPENKRLRDIERAAIFDDLDETKERFFVPMNELARDVQTVLDRESTGIKAGSVLYAKNKAAFLSAVEKAGLSDADQARLAEQWRDFQSIRNDFDVAKQEAIQTGVLARSLQISPQTVNKVFQTGLRDLFDMGSEYEYIQRALMDGLDKHPDVSDVISEAGANLEQFVEALKKPQEHLRDRDWLRGFSRFCTKAAHNNKAAAQLSDERRGRREDQALLREALIEVKRLRSAGRGVTGQSSGDGYAKTTDKTAANGNGLTPEQTDEALKRMDLMARGDTSYIDKLLNK